ncbi:hypothetical protein M9H77_02569 [Catharanthus roseus]|uniref:Uncharacterized protein n=1 Tax=Catharanthus roseus TaxID=4058 RepID=A0ACC0C918_CATRO|nr:hypothetical protein M9H77_02569 [Catharanthus roseus]
MKSSNSNLKNSRPNNQTEQTGKKTKQKYHKKKTIAKRQGSDGLGPSVSEASQNKRRPPLFQSPFGSHSPTQLWQPLAHQGAGEPRRQKQERRKKSNRCVTGTADKAERQEQERRLRYFSRSAKRMRKRDYIVVQTYHRWAGTLFHAILVLTSHNVDPWNNCYSLGVSKLHTFDFLENKSYGCDGSLFYLLGGHCVKFQEEVVEHSQYVLTSLDTCVKNLVEQILVDEPLLIVKAFGFKFFHEHYKEFLLCKEFENQMGSYFKMSDTNICEFLESNEASFVLEIEDQRKSGGKRVLLSLTNSSLRKFLVKKVEGYLCCLIEDLLDESIRRIVETYSYMKPFFETFVIAFKGIGFFENHFLNMKVQLEDPCYDHKFPIGLEVLKALLIENVLSFQFYHLHFKESMFLLILKTRRKMVLE